MIYIINNAVILTTLLYCMYRNVCPESTVWLKTHGDGASSRSGRNSRNDEVDHRALFTGDNLKWFFVSIAIGASQQMTGTLLKSSL